MPRGQEKKAEPVAAGAIAATPAPAAPAPAAAAPPPPPPPPAAAPAPAKRADGRIIATPYAKKLAKDLGISLETVAGSGPNGRITASDVEAMKNGGARRPWPVVVGTRERTRAHCMHCEHPEFHQVAYVLDSKQALIEVAGWMRGALRLGSAALKLSWQCHQQLSQRTQRAL